MEVHYLTDEGDQNRESNESGLKSITVELTTNRYYYACNRYQENNRIIHCNSFFYFFYLFVDKFFHVNY